MSSSENNLKPFPNFKREATPVERLSELWTEAEVNPHKFGRMVVAYEETKPNGNTRLRTISCGCTTNEALGILEIAKSQIMAESAVDPE